MYWEQLELRCRSLYAGPQPPPPQMAGPGGAPSLIGTPRGGPCRCCEQCHSHRNVMPSAYPWDGDSRFWTPAPGQGGNFYSPNPGGDDLMAVANRSMNQVPVVRQQRPGWSWPRLPWQRNEPQRFRQTPSSPDSQYGFSNTPNGQEHPNMQPSNSQTGYTVIGGPPHYGVWGPPPPYSDPNSPARRGRYQYIHPGQCQQIMDHSNMVVPQQSNMAILECHQHSSSTDSHSMEPFCQQQQLQQHRTIIKRPGFKAKDNYENTPSDSDGPQRDRFSNTLPVRKQKKRVEIGAKSIGPNNQGGGVARINVQNVFTSVVQHHNNEIMDHEYQETSGGPEPSGSNGIGGQVHPKQRRIKAGVENSAFMSVETIEVEKAMEPTESEVYFADVSSCCNMSVKNDNFYDDAMQRRMDKFSKEENEDYLVQRFGKREASIRSRLPFPQMIPEDYEKPAGPHQQQISCPTVAPRTSLIHKDLSRQSMCSVESDAKTDFTDLSPATPGSTFPPAPYTIEENDEISYQNGYPSSSSGPSNFQGGNYKSDFSEPTNSRFVASFPYSCNEVSQEAHRRSTKNVQDIFLAPDAQYETIQDGSSNGGNQFDQSLSYEQLVQQHHHDDVGAGGGNNMTAYNSQSSHFHKPKSPKTMNITPIKRQSLGTNISAIIQNLGGSDSGLLYPDGRRDGDEMIDVQNCMGGGGTGASGKMGMISENDWSDHSDRRL